MNNLLFKLIDIEIERLTIDIDRNKNAKLDDDGKNLIQSLEAQIKYYQRCKRYIEYSVNMNELDYNQVQMLVKPVD